MKHPQAQRQSFVSRMVAADNEQRLIISELLAKNLMLEARVEQLLALLSAHGISANAADPGVDQPNG